MALHPIKQPPDGYQVIRDTVINKYFPLQIVGSEWHYFEETDRYGVSRRVGYVKRVEAVKFCERHAQMRGASHESH